MIRILTSRILSLSWLLLAGTAAAESLQPGFKPVMPGFDYAHLQITNQPWSIHVARMDRNDRSFEVISILGKKNIQGLSPLSTQIKSLPAAEGHPVVAVNGDFFVIKPGPYQGDPEGLQILNGELISAPARISFWNDHGQFHIEALKSQFKVTLPGGKTAALGLNETPRPESATLFTPIFGHSTRATNLVELVLEKSGGGPWLPLRANQIYDARIRTINLAGNTPLNPGAAVLTLGSQLTNLVSSMKVGSGLRFSTGISRDLSTTTAAIGGGPILVHDGIEQRWAVDKGTNSLSARNPRTALGFSPRYFYLVEVDGRQTNLSVGMSFSELADLMKSIGCTEAMNLDGGGSSTFWLNGKVMNSPSDKHERSLANAVVIVHK